MNVAPCCKVIVKVVIVNGFIASLNVAVIFPFTDTPVAPLAGTVEITTGGVTSAVVPVVKVHT